MGDDESFASFHTFSDWFSLIGAFVCVTCAALAAGLTMGLLSLDVLKLKIKASVGTDEEKLAVQKILPLVEKDYHYLLYAYYIAIYFKLIDF